MADGLLSRRTAIELLDESSCTDSPTTEEDKVLDLWVDRTLSELIQFRIERNRALLETIRRKREMEKNPNRTPPGRKFPLAGEGHHNSYIAIPRMADGKFGRPRFRIEGPPAKIAKELFEDGPIGPERGSGDEFSTILVFRLGDSVEYEQAKSIRPIYLRDDEDPKLIQFATQEEIEAAEQILKGLAEAESADIPHPLREFLEAEPNTDLGIFDDDEPIPYKAVDDSPTRVSGDSGIRRERTV